MHPNVCILQVNTIYCYPVTVNAYQCLRAINACSRILFFLSTDDTCSSGSNDDLLEMMEGGEGMNTVQVLPTTVCSVSITGQKYTIFLLINRGCCCCCVVVLCPW